MQQPESRIESEETRQTVPETMENVRTERSTENVDYDTLNDYAKGLGENGRKAFVENYDGNLSIDDYQTADITMLVGTTLIWILRRNPCSRP